MNRSAPPSADTRIAVVNVIAGPPPLENWIRDSFRSTLGTLSGVAGLLQFGLVRVSTSGRAVFASITVWSDLDAFERWRTSRAFTAAHPDRQTHAAEFGELTSLRVDFPVAMGVNGLDPIGEIMRQLQSAHPDLVPVDAQLVHELQWSGAPVPAGAPRAAATLVIACSATFLALLDTAVVNMAYSSFTTQFPAAGTALTWVISGFAAAFAAVLTAAGRCADTFGHRRVLVAGVAGFAVTSALCAMAPSAGVLIGARIAQGVAAALMLPAALGAVLASVPSGRTAAGIRAWAASGALAAAVGPAAGAAMVTWWGWRSIFLLNIPLCLVLLPLSVAVLPPGARRREGRPDLAGVLLWSGGVAALVAALTEGHSWGMTSPGTLLLIVAGPLGCAAACWRGGTHSWPALPVRLWQSTPFAISGAVNFTLGVAMGVVLLAVPVFLQQVWRESLLRAAGCIGVIGLAAMASASVCGQGVAARRPGWLCAVGMALIAGSCAICTSQMLNSTTDLPLWWGISVALGVGVGLTVTGLAIITAASVPNSEVSAGLGMGLTLRQTGSALGVALVAAVLTTGPQYVQSLHQLFAVTTAAVLAGTVAAAAIHLPASTRGEAGIDLGRAPRSHRTDIGRSSNRSEN